MKLYKHNNELCVKYFFNVLMIMKMAVVQTFHVIYGRFNIAIICTSENYTVYAEKNQ
jgi:hypothetical protein